MNRNVTLLFYSKNSDTILLFRLGYDSHVEETQASMPSRTWTIEISSNAMTHSKTPPGTTTPQFHSNYTTFTGAQRQQSVSIQQKGF